MYMSVKMCRHCSQTTELDARSRIGGGDDDESLAASVQVYGAWAAIMTPEDRPGPFLLPFHLP